MEAFAGCPSPDAVIAFVEQRASADVRAAMAEHVDACPSCRELLAFAASALLDDGDADAPARRRVGRYRLQRLLDAGGSGIVYEARDPELQRTVALKMLHEGGPELRREAQVIAALHHPSVVRIYDVDRDFIVMELLRGGTLRDWLRVRPRTLAEVMAAFASIAAGLSAVHAAGVVHRDLKPANVLRRDDGTFVVTDFGLSTASLRGATPTGETNVEATAISGRVGTPAYMAPEQARGLRATARSDQYSFALCLLESIAGRRAAVEELAIPRAAKRALLRALAEDPEDRFASVDEMWRAFVRGVSRRQVVAAVGIATVAGLVVAASLLGAGDRCRESAIASQRQLERRIDRVPADDPALAEASTVLVSEWLDASRAACVAQREPELRCLDRERRRLEVVLDGLAERRRGAWEHWRGSLRLVDVSGCADALQEPPLADLRLQEQIDAAEVIAERGDFGGAIAVLDDVIEAASGPALARALRWRAEMFAQTDEFEAALRDGHWAYREAASQGLDAEVARTGFMLVMIALAADEDGAEHWLATADAAVERVGHDLALDTLSAETHARVASRAGDQEAVIAHAQRGLDLVAKQPSQRIHAVDLLLLSGWAYFALVDYGRARAAATEAASISLELRGPDDLSHLEARELEGMIAYAEGRSEEAIAVLEDMRARLLVNPNAPPSFVESVRTTLARAYRTSGRYEAAIAELLPIVQSEREVDPLRMTGPLVAIGWTYIDAGQSEQALPHLARALVLREAAGAGADGTALIGVAMGKALADAGRLDEAVTTFDDAIETLQREQGAGAPQTVWARQLRAAATAARDPEAARRELEHAVEVFTQAIGPDTPYLGSAYEDLAEVESLLGERDAARAHLQQAIAIHTKSGAADNPVLERLRRRLETI